MGSEEKRFRHGDAAEKLRRNKTASRLINAATILGLLLAVGFAVYGFYTGIFTSEENLERFISIPVSLRLWFSFSFRSSRLSFPLSRRRQLSGFSSAVWAASGVCVQLCWNLHWQHHWFFPGPVLWKTFYPSCNQTGNL